MKCNWILFIILFLGCSNSDSPKEASSAPKMDARVLSSMIHRNEKEVEVPEEKEIIKKEEPVVEIPEVKVVEEKQAEAIKVVEEAAIFTGTRQVLSMLDEIPVAGEGQYIVEPPIDTSGYASLEEYYAKAFEGYHEYLTDGVDFPVGKPDGKGYYIAQKYLQNRHLGDDFNANTGGNTDLGDPVYAIANGIVSFAYDLEGGWGNTIRIVHRHPQGDMVESLYSHLDEIKVSFGQFVKRGDLIGTIGTAHGQYAAHLHLEIRTQVNMPLGRGYSDKPIDGYTAPTPFIRQNRPRW